MSLFAAELEEPKIGISGKELILDHKTRSQRTKAIIKGDEYPPPHPNAPCQESTPCYRVSTVC